MIIDTDVRLKVPLSPAAARKWARLREARRGVGVCEGCGRPHPDDHACIAIWGPIPRYTPDGLLRPVRRDEP